MKIADILSFLETEEILFHFVGDAETGVDGFSSLNKYRSGSFTWIKSKENIPPQLDLSQITLAISAENNLGPFQNTIYSPNSKRAFFSAIEHFYGQKETCSAIGRFTYISPEVKLGKNVRIGHNCTLDGRITIGDDTIIWNHVTIINQVHIGRNCEIQSGTVIGHDGFAYTEDTEHKKVMIKHFGGVEIGDNVFIGSNVCICRGTIDDTVLSAGVKIDNISHIAHNCTLGADAVLAYPCKLGGSTHIAENGYLAGAITRNQSKIGRDAFVGIGAVVIKNVEDGQIVVGNPAKPFVKKV